MDHYRAEVVEFIDQRGLSEKYLQPKLRTEEAEEATASATRTA